MVQNRIDLADNYGLDLYSKILRKSLNFWIKAIEDLKEYVFKDPDLKNGLASLLTMAATTEGMVWDEKVRIKYTGITSEVKVTDSSNNLETKFNESIVRMNSFLSLASIKKGKETNLFWYLFYPIVS